MAFQPDPLIDGLYYPSSARALGGGYYSPDGLTEDPNHPHLYLFNVGDFAYPVLKPSPHIEMTLFDFDDACVAITVYRTVGKRSTPVRAAIAIDIDVDGVNVVDWAAPFGVPLGYWCAQYDADGTLLGVTAPMKTRLDYDRTVIHNPLDPANSVEVELARGAAAKLARGQDADTVWFDGTGIATAVTGQRHGVTDTPVRFYTLTDDDTEKVNDLLGDPYDVASGPMILCIRPAGQLNVPWPQPFIALVDLEQQPINLHAGLQATLWDGTGTETQEPALGLIAAVLTYEDLYATYGTYEALYAAYGTYQEMYRDYRLAGTVDVATGPAANVPTNLGIYGAGIYGS